MDKIESIQEATDEAEQAKSDDLERAEEKDATQTCSKFETSEIRNTRRRVVHSRSPIKQVRTKTQKIG